MSVDPTTWADRGSNIWRELVSGGSATRHKPIKADIRAWAANVEAVATVVAALTLGSASDTQAKLWLANSVVMHAPQDATLSYTNFGVGGAANSLTNLGGGENGRHNTWIGKRCFTNATQAKYCTVGGVETCETLTTGSYISAFGEAIMPYSTNATRVSALGWKVLLNAGAVADIAAVGYNVMNNATTAAQFAALGNNVFWSITDKTNGSAVGHSAFYNANANGLTGLGAFAGFDVTSGDLHMMIGYNTGRGITTGRACTIIGSSVTGLSSTLSNTIILADGDGTKRLWIDSTGKAGLGNFAPTQALSIGDSATLGSAANTYITVEGGSAGETGVFFRHASSNAGSVRYDANTTSMYFKVSDTEKLRIYSGSIWSTVPIQFPTYAKAALPAATANRIIFVSDDVGGLTPAFSDGTNWRRVADRAVIA